MPSTRKNNTGSGNDAADQEISHPIYSDYSHMTALTDIGFAVTLREHSNTGVDLLQKIFPLTKVIPKLAVSPPKEKKPKIKVAKVKKIESLVCERSDCADRKGQLADIKLENAGLRAQFKIIEAKAIAARNKKALLEKGILISLDKNEAIKNAINTTQSRLETIDVDLERENNSTEKLRSKIGNLQDEISLIKLKIEKDSEQIRIMNEMKSSGVMKFARTVDSRESRILAAETLSLGANDPDMSDDEQ